MTTAYPRDPSIPKQPSDLRVLLGQAVHLVAHVLNAQENQGPEGSKVGFEELVLAGAGPCPGVNRPRGPQAAPASRRQPP